jgi:hypothetical protein
MILGMFVDSVHDMRNHRNLDRYAPYENIENLIDTRAVATFAVSAFPTPREADRDGDH